MPDMKGPLASCALVWLACAAQAQTILARVAFEAPSGPRLVLRSVLPLPPDREPSAPLAMRFPGREGLVATQAIPVTRAGDGRVEVVELVAVVDAPATWRSGARMVASVLDGAAGAAPPAGSPRLDARIAELLDRSRPGQLYLRTFDVHGNEYRADLSGVPRSPGFQVARVLDSGPLLRRRRVASVFVPVEGGANGATAPLPHLMGVHAYLVERADMPALSIDVRVHNGLASPSRAPNPLEAPLGPVWFKCIELVAPAGYSVEPDIVDAAMGPPRVEAGSVVLPLVATAADGRLQCMPSQSQFQRRLVLRTADADWVARDLSAFRDLGFPVSGRGLWSWESLPRWFPQREQLPSPSIYGQGNDDGAQVVRERDLRELERLQSALTSGKAQKWPLVADAMGWCHPWLEQQQGTTGGYGILLSDGHWSVVCASRAGVQRLALQHRMAAARQPQAAYDRWGRPLSADLWLDEAGRVPFDYRMNGDVRPRMFLGREQALPAAVEQARLVEERGLRPAWDRGDPYAKRTTLRQEATNIHAWWPFDDQHLVRWTAPAKALVWAANDALARDDLQATAELARLAMHELPHGGGEWGASATLPAMERRVAAVPHAGLPWGRGQAWMIDVMAAAHATADDAWRTAHRDWFERVHALLVLSAPPTGLPMRTQNPRHKLAARYDTAQAFECILLLHAQRTLAEGVWGEGDRARRDQLRALHLAACTYLFRGPPWQATKDQRGNVRRGPRQIFAVGLRDDPATPPFGTAPRWPPNWLPDDACEGGIEVHWSWSALAHAWRLSAGAEALGWSERLLQLDAGAADQGALRSEAARLARNTSTDNTANMLELLRLWQDYGVSVR